MERREECWERNDVKAVRAKRKELCWADVWTWRQGSGERSAALPCVAMRVPASITMDGPAGGTRLAEKGKPQI